MHACLFFVQAYYLEGTAVRGVIIAHQALGVPFLCVTLIGTETQTATFSGVEICRLQNTSCVHLQVLLTNLVQHAT